MDKLTIFVNRMKKIGIDITFVGNFPWIYIDTINGKKVTERFYGKHGFTIAFLSPRRGVGIFTDISQIFKLIKKYTHENN